MVDFKKSLWMPRESHILRNDLETLSLSLTQSHTMLVKTKINKQTSTKQVLEKRENLISRATYYNIPISNFQPKNKITGHTNKQEIMVHLKIKKKESQ